MNGGSLASPVIAVKTYGSVFASAERKREQKMGKISILVKGMVIGGGIALLMAPKTGKKFRKELSGKADHNLNKMMDYRETAMDKADHFKVQMMKNSHHGKMCMMKNGHHAKGKSCCGDGHCKHW
jgi:gas vesicle protein